ncbi:DUF2218 domain-containing protein [Streptomyces sp. NPDC001070]
MLIAEATVRTDRASRYLAQLCEHPSRVRGHLPHWSRLHHGGSTPPRIRHVERSGTHGTIDVGSGRCILRAGPDSLTLRVEAADQDGLLRIQQLLAERLQRTGKHDAPRVTWRQAEAADHLPGDPATAAPARAENTAPGTRRGATLGVVTVVALVVAVHLGLGGLLLASGPWKHWAVGAVVAALLVKTAVLLGRRAARRRKEQEAR